MEDFFASCSKGLEEILEQELKSIAEVGTEIQHGGVYFKVSHKDSLKILLYSRVASRLFKKITTIEFNTEEELYREAKKYKWTSLLSTNQTFKIQVILDYKIKNDFSNSIYLSQKFKDGLVDQYREKSGGRPSVNKNNPDYPLLVRIEKSESSEKLYRGIVYVDLCQKPLSNRGYRLPGHRAPLRENLAAALIMQSEWKASRAPLVDLFSGSGTFLIEAALIKAKIPPSYLKLFKPLYENFAFINQKWFQKDQELKSYFFNEINVVKKSLDRASLLLKDGYLFGFEKDKKYIELIFETIKQAKLPLKPFKIQQGDALTTIPPTKMNGLIISNPPYGERLKEDHLLELYYQLGENFKSNWKNWEAHLLVSDNELRKAISLRTEKRFIVWNGQLECRFLKYSLF